MKITAVNPLRDYLLIKAVTPEESTLTVNTNGPGVDAKEGAMGIFLTQHRNMTDFMICEVLSTGPEVPEDLSTGDYVLVGTKVFAPTPGLINDDWDTEFMLIHYQGIAATCETDGEDFDVFDKKSELPDITNVKKPNSISRPATEVDNG